MLYALVIGLGTAHPMIIPAIATEASCIALGEQIVVDMKGGNYKCYGYRATNPGGDVVKKK